MSPLAELPYSVTMRYSPRLPPLSPIDVSLPASREYFTVCCGEATQAKLLPSAR